MFDVEETINKIDRKDDFESRYESIAKRFKSMFDLPLPLLIEDSQINLDLDLKFSPDLVGLKRDNILFYDLSQSINQKEFHSLMDLAFLWTVEGIILSNIDTISPDNLPGAQNLVTRILTEEDMSGTATFYGNPPNFLQFPSKNFDEKIYETWNSRRASGQPRKKGRIKVALICKKLPGYLKNKNIFCSKIQMSKE